ncbi:accessory Sec system translocase SecA2 [Paenisporosarcina quisquiliarum]|uniref:accessory Sec system translocase SecA2 n=1 Tax=Paenisporosarcina quisquiliarum TaxID=365346 RepID=UPI0037369902
MSIPIKKIFSADSRKLRNFYKEVSAINKLESSYESLSNEELKNQTTIFKERLLLGEDLMNIRTEAFALVREASKRILGMRHFDVQLIGGLVLSEGNISEMPTGEGKTLVASLPSYLHGLTGKGVHVITVNEYLAKRDKEQIGQIHEFLGLSVGLNLPMMDPNDKKAAYAADITYGLGAEFGFDYLRDNMAFEASMRVQRPFYFALVDEVDSVLIDEAKTPLIIAGKTDVHPNLSHLCAKLSKSFKGNHDYTFDLHTKSVSYTEEGIEKIERYFSVDNLYDLEHQTLYHYMIQSLRARVMFIKDVDYIVKEGKVMLIDMFTGRPMEGRTLSNGLHQAIEAKEGLVVTEENKTQASITIQNYFRMYPKIGGMTGTAKNEEKEFNELYSMEVTQIPTNKPVIRKDLDDVIFDTVDAKYFAVAEKVKEIHATGQPVLIGTTSILQSEKVADFLSKEKLQFELLNAKTIQQEISLISLAGQKNAITVATNMAGRGTDILLGEGVAELGGLFVLGTERHESRRIDNQLKGRSGRQGDPGITQFYISIEDDMLQRFAEEELDKLKKKIKADKKGIITQKSASEFVSRTQRICEGSMYGMREYNLKLDNILNEQRQTIYGIRDQLLFGEQIEETFIRFLRDLPYHEIERLFDQDAEVQLTDLALLSINLQKYMPTETIPTWEFVTEEAQIIEEIQPIFNEYLPKVNELLAKAVEKDQLRLYLIQVVDTHWLRHMESMERLKEGIGMRSYAQEDPMRQYEREALILFQQMSYLIERDIAIEIGKLVSHYNHQTKGEDL